MGAARPPDRHRLIVAGNANLDVLIGPVPPWPAPGTEVVAERFLWRVGGGLGNVAMALQALGVPARLVWDVGDDLAGRFLTAELPATRPARTLPAPTSVTVGVVHTSGERTFLTHLGHLDVSTPDALEAEVLDARDGDHLLVVGTFLLPRWRPALPAILAEARERGVVTVLDTGWPTGGWTSEVIDELPALLEHVDLFLPNLEEARGVLALPEASPHEALRGLAPWVGGATVLKLGAEGAAYASDGAVHRCRAPAVDVADTVGAGDTFNAALLAGLIEGWPLAMAVAAAVEMASRAVASHPRRYPTGEELARAASTHAV